MIHGVKSTYITGINYYIDTGINKNDSHVNFDFFSPKILYFIYIHPDIEGLRRAFL